MIMMIDTEISLAAADDCHLPVFRDDNSYAHRFLPMFSSLTQWPLLMPAASAALQPQLQDHLPVTATVQQRQQRRQLAVQFPETQHWMQ